MAGIELVPRPGDRRRNIPWHRQMGATICHRAQANFGVLLRPLGDVLVVMPPLSITEDQLDRLMEVFSLLRSRRQPRESPTRE